MTSSLFKKARLWILLNGSIDWKLKVNWKLCNKFPGSRSFELLRILCNFETKFHESTENYDSPNVAGLKVYQVHNVAITDVSIIYLLFLIFLSSRAIKSKKEEKKAQTFVSIPLSAGSCLRESSDMNGNLMKGTWLWVKRWEERRRNLLDKINFLFLIELSCFKPRYLRARRV